MNAKQRDMAMNATFMFQATVTAFLTESPEEALVFDLEHFDPILALVLDKPKELVTSMDVRKLMIETATKAVKLLSAK